MRWPGDWCGRGASDHSCLGKAEVDIAGGEANRVEVLRRRLAMSYSRMRSGLTKSCDSMGDRSCSCLGVMLMLSGSSTLTPQTLNKLVPSSQLRRVCASETLSEGFISSQAGRQSI